MQIDPTGTHFAVKHPGGEVLSFVVSDAAGPLWLKDLRVNNPAALSSDVAYIAANTVQRVRRTPTHNQGGSDSAVGIAPRPGILRPPPAGRC